MLTTSRPAIDEYAPAFADYVAEIRDAEDVRGVLADQLDEIPSRLGSLPDSTGDHSYAPGKWSLKEVLGHLSDTERVFAYRALRIGRGDTTPLPGYDDQAWIPEMEAADLSLADMVQEFTHVRQATLALFRHLPPAAWTRRGTADGRPISVRALAYVIAGHTRHHLRVVKERYLG